MGSIVVQPRAGRGFIVIVVIIILLWIGITINNPKSEPHDVAGSKTEKPM